MRALDAKIRLREKRCRPVRLQLSDDKNWPKDKTLCCLKEKIQPVQWRPKRWRMSGWWVTAASLRCWGIKGSKETGSDWIVLAFRGRDTATVRHQPVSPGGAISQCCYFFSSQWTWNPTLHAQHLVTLSGYPVICLSSEESINYMFVF